MADYVTTAEAKADYEVVTNFCDVVESRLQSDFTGIRDAFPAIIRFAEYVLTHFAEYGYALEADKDLRQRLRTIQQRCTEPGRRAD